MMIIYDNLIQSVAEAQTSAKLGVCQKLNKLVENQRLAYGQ